MSRPISKEAIFNVAALEPYTAGKAIAFPGGVQLKTDSTANILAAAPGTVGSLRLASDTGALYYADSDSKYHSCRTRGYATDYDVTFGTAVNTSSSATISKGSNERSHRAVLNTGLQGVKIPAGFGTVLLSLSWTITGGTYTGYELYIASADWSHRFMFPGDITSGSFVMDASGFVGSDSGAMLYQPLNITSLVGGTVDPTSFTGKLDVAAFGSEIWYQTS